MSPTADHIRIGVIADTHGLFDPAVVRHFSGVDRIIHAGDIGHRSVIERLACIAPVIAVSGNADDPDAVEFPSETVVKLAGRCVAVRHVIYESGKIRKDAEAFLVREQPAVCIFGHTHQPNIEMERPHALVQPRSAGPKRFTLPRGLGLLFLSNTRVVPRFIRLQDHPEGCSPMRRNF